MERHLDINIHILWQRLIKDSIEDVNQRWHDPECPAADHQGRDANYLQAGLIIEAKPLHFAASNSHVPWPHYDPGLVLG
ncbi:MAG: hypothetical protein Rhims3KO_05840 [Hyphomicrobiales bacterium]